MVRVGPVLLLMLLVSIPLSAGAAANLASSGQALLVLAALTEIVQPASPEAMAAGVGAALQSASGRAAPEGPVRIERVEPPFRAMGILLTNAIRLLIVPSMLLLGLLYARALRDPRGLRVSSRLSLVPLALNSLLAGALLSALIPQALPIIGAVPALELMALSLASYPSASAALGEPVMAGRALSPVPVALLLLSASASIESWVLGVASA
ncbi:MAG: hypothetical protein QXW56_05965 [Nitrososphaerota archaeon]